MTSPADAARARRRAFRQARRSTASRCPSPSAVRVGDILYLSGQIGIGADGKLPDGIEAQTRQALDNIGARLKRAGLGYGDIFHCTAMLADMKTVAGLQQSLCDLFPRGKAARPERVRRQRSRARRLDRARVPGLRGNEVGLVPRLFLLRHRQSCVNLTRVTVSFSTLAAGGGHRVPDLAPAWSSSTLRRPWSSRW